MIRYIKSCDYIYTYHVLHTNNGPIQLGIFWVRCQRDLILSLNTVEIIPTARNFVEGKIPWEFLMMKMWRNCVFLWITRLPQCLKG